MKKDMRVEKMTRFNSEKIIKSYLKCNQSKND